MSVAQGGLILLTACAGSALAAALRWPGRPPSGDTYEKLTVAAMLVPLLAAGLALLGAGSGIEWSVPLPVAADSFAPRTVPSTAASPVIGAPRPTNALFGALLGVWALVGLFRLGALARSAFRLRRIVADAEPFGRHGVLVSPDVGAPLAAFGKVVVPPGFGREAAAPLILEHERAHLRRRDPAYFLLLSALRAVLWHDLLLARQVQRCRLAAEIACDAAALEGAPTERRPYAEALLLGLKRAAGTALHGGPAAFPPRNLGDHRMRMTHILRPAGPRGKQRSLRTLALGAAALPASLAVAMAGNTQAEGTLSVVPTEGRLTSTFGPRIHPLTREPANHRGIDIAAPRGTPVLAAGAGRVTEAGEQGRYGLTIVVDHGDGVFTRYAQLDDVAVRWNDQVEAGQQIGAVGSSGQSTAPHLHFEVRRGGAWVDPADELDLPD